MGNTILTPTAVTREALRVLHAKLKFIGSINREYDDQYAKKGAKIGNDLKIRLPNQYTVRTGAVLDVNDTAEDSVTLSVSTQKGVDINFSSEEMTMDLDDFSKRILQPAMARLASEMEKDAYSMYRDVANMVDSDAAAINYLNILDARKRLVEMLVPDEDTLNVQLSPFHVPKLLNDLKSLTNDPRSISKNYKDGMVASFAASDFYQNTHATNHTTGTAAKTTGYTVNGATQNGSTITIQSGSTTFLVGDVVTFAGCNEVHPETKADLGYLKQFVVTANSGTSATSLSISPALIPPAVNAAKANCSGYPTGSGAVVKVGAGANETLTTSMMYHKDAFTFATADLVMPSGVDFAARQVLDGISMRIVRQYDINNDQFPCRLDVLYGYKAIRPQLACRIHADA
jgi:hypothetical protein